MEKRTFWNNTSKGRAYCSQIKYREEYSGGRRVKAHRVQVTLGQSTRCRWRGHWDHLKVFFKMHTRPPAPLQTLASAGGHLPRNGSQIPLEHKREVQVLSPMHFRFSATLLVLPSTPQVKMTVEINFGIALSVPKSKAGFSS